MRRATISARTGPGSSARSLGVGGRRLDEDGPPSTSPERVAEGECGHVVEWHEVDLLELGVEPDRRVGDGQVVGGRSPFFSEP
jgi:hypothetical protein